ncbi:hypothetical protein [Acinetobacter junii]|uniref:hypothetical protein n=1 Tax=Acinetobacter junii TaxID=40215 RepID=UPI00148F2E76|nr:hypothetical protein [Acinetobacter junii]
MMKKVLLASCLLIAVSSVTFAKTEVTRIGDTTVTTDREGSIIKVDHSLIKPEYTRETHKEATDRIKEEFKDRGQSISGSEKGNG